MSSFNGAYSGTWDATRGCAVHGCEWKSKDYSLHAVRLIDHQHKRQIYVTFCAYHASFLHNADRGVVAGPPLEAGSLNGMAEA